MCCPNSVPQMRASPAVARGGLDDYHGLAIRAAQENLSTQGLANPPFEGIEFVIRDP
jgi:hypothetical protein